MAPRVMWPRLRLYKTGLRYKDKSQSHRPRGWCLLTFVLVSRPVLDNRHRRSCLASRRSVSGRGHVAQVPGLQAAGRSGAQPLVYPHEIKSVKVFSSRRKPYAWKKWKLRPREIGGAFSPPDAAALPVAKAALQVTLHLARQVKSSQVITLQIS